MNRRILILPILLVIIVLLQYYYFGQAPGKGPSHLQKKPQAILSDESLPGEGEKTVGVTGEENTSILQEERAQVENVVSSIERSDSPKTRSRSRFRGRRWKPDLKTD